MGIVAGEYKIGKKSYMKNWYATTNAYSQTREYKNNYTLNYHRNNPELYMWKKAKVRAKKDGKEFSIDPSDIIIPEVCPILDIKLSGVREGKVKDSTPSLDRKDNTKGYIKGNIFVISYRANVCKSNLTLEDIRRLYEYALPTSTE